MSTGRPTALALTEYLLLSKRDEAGLRHRWKHMESVEAATVFNELRPLVLERLSNRLLRPLGMGVRLGPRETPVDKPGVQLLS